MGKKSFPEHPCLLCDGFIQAGKDETKWGLDWPKGSVHYSCIENIFDATRRMRNKPEIAQLEESNKNLLESLVAANELLFSAAKTMRKESE